jgi:hypothetical protein
VVVFAVFVFRSVVIAVVADETDVNAHEQREHQRLHETYQQFEEIERERKHRPVQETFTAEDIAKKAE